LNTHRPFTLTHRKPDEIIAYGPAGAVRVDQFLADASLLAGRLPSHRYVVNLAVDHYDYLLGFCASVLAGKCTLMPPNRLDATLAQLERQYPDSHTIGDSKKPLLEKSTAARSTGDPRHRPEIPADQLCAILFTSGSTGEPAPNLKYWDTLQTGGYANARLLFDGQGARLNLLATVPSQHMWGFETATLLPLSAAVAVSHRAPFYPQDIAEALGSLPEPRALVSSPVHLSALLKSGVSLPAVDRILCSTAPLARELAINLEEGFRTRVFEIFGCSESGMLATRNTARETLWRLSDAFQLEPRDDGVEVQSRHLPGNFILPDLIRMAGDHHFEWLGRHQDMINIAGKRGSLSDLNHRLTSIDGVLDGVVFMPETDSARLAAMVVAPDLKPADIINALRPQVEPVFLPRPICMISALPRQETGKLAKAEVLKLFAETRRNGKPE
jgi:acyl-coenzyme A synthetase/AMP-(fatty) acid ligase